LALGDCGWGGGERRDFSEKMGGKKGVVILSSPVVLKGGGERGEVEDRGLCLRRNGDEAIIRWCSRSIVFPAGQRNGAKGNGNHSTVTNRFHSRSGEGGRKKGLPRKGGEGGDNGVASELLQ